MNLRLTARLAGPLLCLLASAFGPAALDPAGRRALGVALWMVTWWITECAPILATSLLPVALFPVLGIATTREATAPYANELVFLFLAGFLLAAALERWRCHERLAFRLVLGVGLTGRRVVLGIMVATAVLSMWISNTATAAMMYPIAMAVGALFAGDPAGDRVRTAIMLGIAYAASIGGMATLIGTPPNLVVAGALRELTGQPVSFVRFMALGLPIALVLLPACWALLVFVVFPSPHRLAGDAGALLRNRLAALGPVRGGEARVLACFALAAFAWVAREPKTLGTLVIPGLTDLLPGLTDAAIGIAVAVPLFLLSGTAPDGARRPLLAWEDARRIPWEILFFFGGGLTLAQAAEAHGVTAWLGQGLDGLRGWPPAVVYLGLGATVLLLSELASNLAVATMVMPLAAALGRSIGQPPEILMLVAGFAASTGFALPIATPPNTIVFGSGMVTGRQMARAGLLLDLVAVLVIAGLVTLLGPVLFPPPAAP